MWTDDKKKSPYTCLFLCLCFFLFIVLNEMSPMVSFLVGYVRNYFQKFVCMQIMSDQSMAFSETTKWGNHSPGMWEQLHQKFELRKASGLASWEAVPSSPFELDLGPGFFTSGFGLKGVQLCHSLYHRLILKCRSIGVFQRKYWGGVSGMRSWWEWCMTDYFLSIMPYTLYL